jgi:general stress protein 26
MVVFVYHKNVYEGVEEMSSFAQEQERFERFLDQHTVWVLATGAGSEISARSMSIIHQGLKIYFQTDTSFEKYRHISTNPNVALCCSNYQVKGYARILGHASEEANAALMSRYKEVHPGSYERYSSRESQCLIEVEPRTVQIWDYIGNEPYITRMDMVNETVVSAKYE